MGRKVNVTVLMNAVDHETFGANQTGASTQRFSMVIDESMPANRLEVVPLKVGGEVRVEMDVAVQIVTGTTAQVAGKARLYEGASDDTDDLEEEKDFVFLVPKGGDPKEHHVELRNRGFGGGDSASITLVATNSITED
jgi:hypothetical protein